MKKMLFGTALAALTLFSATTFAASDTADATATVTAAIGILSDGDDLVFGSGIQSDVAFTVAPGDANSASFSISGQASTAYTITLPADATVVMTTGAGSVANDKIAVNSFASSPAAGANGLLDGTGDQTLTVGAERAALLATQTVASDYTATFTIDVVY